MLDFEKGNLSRSILFDSMMMLAIELSSFHSFTVYNFEFNMYDLGSLGDWRFL
jgi:hypothetical protein